MPSAAPSHHNYDNESESGSEGHVDPRSETFTRFSDDDNIEPLEPDDFPDYFREEQGRLFPSSQTSPYPLPVDTPEQERLNAFNSLIHQLIGANYVEAVSNILRRVPSGPPRQARVLDLCTGTGTWLMEIASEFPNVLFTGIDIVPIATRYPLPNVNFEIGDIAEGFRWSNATFDFVHARCISMSIRSYTTILPEVVRVMRPGGVYVSGELDFAVFFHPDSPQASNPVLHAPASMQFFEVVNDALRARGIQTVVSQIPTYLQNTGAFERIEPRVFYVPIGNWHDDLGMQGLGRRLQAILGRFAESVKPLLLQSHGQGYVDALVQAFCSEMDTAHGLLGAYHIVEAFKPDPPA